MKYGQHKQQTQNLVSNLFEKHDVFFAFSREQIERGAKAGVKYFAMDGGMFIPQANHDSFNEEFELMTNSRLKEAKELFTPTEIIMYELGNHEYSYTYDLQDTQDALEEFAFTQEQYTTAVKEYLLNCKDF